MMQTPAKLLTAFAATIGVAALLAFSVGAQDSASQLTSSQIESIRNNCVVSQASLQRLRDSDLIARTIHGRSYNDLSLIIKAFNARAVSNGINVPELIAVPSSLDSIYRDFYDDYTKYASSLGEALNTDCRNNPERFYTLFLRVEQNREQLATDVSGMQKLLSDYKKDVQEVRAELQSSQNGGSR